MSLPSSPTVLVSSYFLFLIIVDLASQDLDCFITSMAKVTSLSLGTTFSAGLVGVSHESQNSDCSSLKILLAAACAGPGLRIPIAAVPIPLRGRTILLPIQVDTYSFRKRHCKLPNRRTPQVTRVFLHQRKYKEPAKPRMWTCVWIPFYQLSLQ